MKTFLVSAVAYVLFVFDAFSQPWVISGQTSIEAQTGIDNPLPSAPGAIGQVTRLPYTVPQGRVLCITDYVMEGYDFEGIAVLFVYTGMIPEEASVQEAVAHRIARGLPSVAADQGSAQITSMNYCFPGGTVINVRLINGTNVTAVYGWGVWGTLRDE